MSLATTVPFSRPHGSGSHSRSSARHSRPQARCWESVGSDSRANSSKWTSPRHFERFAAALEISTGCPRLLVRACHMVVRTTAKSLWLFVPARDQRRAYSSNTGPLQQIHNLGFWGAAVATARPFGRYLLSASRNMGKELVRYRLLRVRYFPSQHTRGVGMLRRGGDAMIVEIQLATER